MKRITLALLFVMQTVPVFSQKDSRWVSTNPVSRQVNAMAVDKDHYLWLGTPAGVSIFSGTNYKNITRENYPELLSEDIMSICPDQTGAMWIGSVLGMNRMEAGRITQTVPDVGIVRDMLDLDDGHILAIGNPEMFTTDKRNASVDTLRDGDNLIRDRRIYATPYHIWITDVFNKKILIFDRSEILNRPSAIVLDHMEANDFSIHDGKVLLATNAGIRAYDESTLKDVSTREPLCRITGGKEILSIDNYKDGLVYSVASDGFYFFEPAYGQTKRMEGGHDFSAMKEVLTLVDEDMLWISVNHALPVKINLDDIRKRIDLPGLEKQERIHRILPVPSGNAYLVICERHIFYVDKESHQVKDVSPEWLRQTTAIHCLYESMSEGKVWTLTEEGQVCLLDYAGPGVTTLKQLTVEKARCLWEYEDELCVSSPGKLTIVRTDGTAFSLTTTSFLDHQYSFKAASGNIFTLSAGSKDTGSTLSFFRFNKEKHFIPLGVPARTVCIEESPEGILYAGTMDDGLFVYDKDRKLLHHINSASGLEGNYVSDIAILEDGALIFTKTGICRIDRNGNILKTFFNPVQTYEMFNPPTIGRYCDRSIFYGGEGYLLTFPLDETAEKETRSLHIDGFVIDTTPYLPSETIILGRKDRSFSVYFSYPNYRETSSISYSYMLEGYDRDWINSGSEQRLHYSHLPAGKYVLKIRANDRKDISLDIPVYVSQTIWRRTPMKMLYALITAMLAYFLIRIYLRWKFKDRELELARREKSLTEALAKDKSDFFNNLSHEFRTPLTLIYGPATELYADDTLPEHSHKLVSLIKSNSDRMLKLSNEMLDFNRTAAPSVLKIAGMDLPVQIRKFYENFQYIFKEKNLKFTLKMPDTLPVYCDRDKVEKIFFNLMSNAVKYTPEGGEIRAEVYTLPKYLASKSFPALQQEPFEGRYVVMSIIDTGVGIPENMKKKIFERYQRLNSKVGDRNPEGYGIGLNYALYLAHVHKGLLDVTDNKPSGSVFSFVFPADKEGYPGENLIDRILVESYTPAQYPEHDILENIPPEEAVNVLIVEDNRQMLNYLEDILKKSYQTMTAMNGEEAAQYLELSTPDLVISDISMPLKDGITLCREIKANPQTCHIPVILLTGMDSPEMQQAGLDSLADAYLPKPFDPIMLKKVIHNLLENRKRMQAGLVNRTSTTMEATETETNNLNAHDRRFLEKLYVLMDEHLGDENFSIASCAREFGISRSGLYAKLKALVGETPQNYVTTYRLNKAMELLRTKDFNVNEVCYMVGFKSPSAFSRSFKNKFGVPPSSI